MITANDNPNNLSRIADLEAEVIRLQAVNEAQERSIDELQRLFNGIRAAFGELHKQGQNSLIGMHEFNKRLKNVEADLVVDEANIAELYRWAREVDKCFAVANKNNKKGK